MNLNDDRTFPSIDRSNMLALIDAVPQQFLLGWELGLSAGLPSIGQLRNILCAGVGGAAAAADLLSVLLTPTCRLPCVVHHDYGLPAWAGAENTLVIAISHSGESEETISALQEALARKCRTLAVTTGGSLAEIAEQHGLPMITYTHNGPSRTAIALVYGLLLALFKRLALIEINQTEIEAAVESMRRQQTCLSADAPLARNPAKRIAGQFLERWVAFFSAEHLAPLGRRWKNQINETAKALAFQEIIPEANYNALMGFSHPPEEIPHGMLFYLASALYHERNRTRMELTRKNLMLEGISSDFYLPPGSTRLSQQCCALHFGDYLAYYLAMLYEVDPTPVDMLDALKSELSA